MVKLKEIMNYLSEDDKREISSFLGFALFNLNKGKYDAAEVLIRKAYKALNGKEWDE